MIAAIFGREAIGYDARMSTNADDLPVVPLAPPPEGPAPDAEFGAAAPAESATAAVQAQCANCGAPLLGAHCYACGQPVKGMVRHLSSILADAADSILNIDSRIFRTLPALFLRPGFLTTEYFAGRRVRYVTPFRLYFFLSIAAFFLIQFAVGDLNMLNAIDMRADAQDLIGAALTQPEVEKQRDLAIANLRTTESALAGNEKATRKVEAAIDKLQRKSEERIAYLDKVDQAKAKGEAPPPEPHHNFISFDGTPWDAKTHPIRIGWLPQFANDKLNQLAAHTLDNMSRIAKDPKPFLVASIGVLPQVLFVLMPVFAFMLKIFYIFKRRLYMEHLVVALHSHAFIFLSLFILTLVSMAANWATQSAAWLHTPLAWLVFAISWWLPIYLLIMQKRVYKQGWILTVLKYCTIGIAYSVLIALGVGAAFIVSLATI